MPRSVPPELPYLIIAAMLGGRRRNANWDQVGFADHPAAVVGNVLLVAAVKFVTVEPRTPLPL